MKQEAERTIGGHRTVNVSFPVESMRIEEGGGGAGGLGGISKGDVGRLQVRMCKVDAVVAEYFESGWNGADIERGDGYAFLRRIREGVKGVVEGSRENRVQVLRLLLNYRTEHSRYRRRLDEYLSLK